MVWQPDDPADLQLFVSALMQPRCDDRCFTSFLIRDLRQRVPNQQYDWMLVLIDDQDLGA